MNEEVRIGRMPSEVVPGWDGEVVCWYVTNLTGEDWTAEKHEELVQPIIDKQMHDSYDHGQEWRLEKVEAVVWRDYYQVTLAQFRIRDSY